MESSGLFSPIGLGFLAGLALLALIDWLRSRK